MLYFFKDIAWRQLLAAHEVAVGLVPLRLQELRHGRGSEVPDVVAVEREGARDRQEPAEAGRNLRPALPEDGPQDEARPERAEADQGRPQAHGRLHFCHG